MNINRCLGFRQGTNISVFPAIKSTIFTSLSFSKNNITDTQPMRTFLTKSTLILSLFFCTISCSESDPIIDDEIEEPVFFSQISYDNIFQNEVVSSFVLNFEQNKVIREDVFNPEGTLVNYYINDYNDDGLLEKRTYYNADESVDVKLDFSYNTGKIDLIQEIRIGNREIPDTLFYKITYVGDVIQNEFTDSDDNPLGLITYTLNNEGLIYKSDDGRMTVEGTFLDGIPVSKTIVDLESSTAFDYAYLDSPEPKGPWKTFWGNYYGGFNNQIIARKVGLYAFEYAVDLPKYISKVGDQLSREYEFDAENLPTRITTDFGAGLESIWTLEYQN